MKQTRALTAGCLFVTALAESSCRGRIEDDRPEHAGPGLTPIVGAEARLDDTHTAVVAIRTRQNDICSGTIVQRTADGAGLYVLTAAHCCEEGSSTADVLIGDWATAISSGSDLLRLPVESQRRHPCYRSQFQTDGYDFCVLRVRDDGRLRSVEPIPLASAPDHLAVGSSVTLVGYGSTPAWNFARRRVAARVAGIGPLWIEIGEGNGSLCHGDSGGPTLFLEEGVEVIAGVNALASQGILCNEMSASGRVSGAGVRADFIDRVLAGEEPVVQSYLVQRVGASPGPARDTTLASDAPDRSFGDGVELLVGAPPGSAAIRRALVRFDLPVLPAGATLRSAQAVLTQTSNDGNGTIEAHRVTKDWDEERETWASFGDDGFDRTPTRNTALHGFNEARFDLTLMVQDWLDGRVMNYGILLRDEGGAETRFQSSEIEAGNRPRLNLCYRIGRP
jgi:hypothetical protein